MKKEIKIIFLLLQSFFIFFLNGCAKKDKSPEKNVVYVWAHEGQPFEKKALENIVQSFNTLQDNIQIKIDFKAEQGYADRLRSAALTSQLPDIIEIDGPYTAHFANLNILCDLDDLFSENFKDDFLPTIIDQGTYQDKLYTLGAFDSTIVLFYNKKILKDMKIEIPQTIEQAWEWETFNNILQEIKETKPGILPLETFMTWKGEWLPYAFLPIIWSNKSSVLSPDNNNTNGFLNHIDTVNALKKWQSLFTDRLADMHAAPGLFEIDKAAFSWGIFNRWPIYQDKGVDFGMMPLPKIKSPKSPSGSWCWGIAQSSTNKDQAVEVLKWFLNPRHGIIPMCKANGGIPARWSAFKDYPEYIENRKLFVDQLKQSGKTRPKTPHYASLSQILSKAMENIARGGSVEKILNQAASDIDDILSAYKINDK